MTNKRDNKISRDTKHLATDGSATGVQSVSDDREAHSTEMGNYVILLKEADTQPGGEPMERHEVYEAGVSNTATFRRKLRKWLETEDLTSQVAGIGEPNAFSLLWLTSTPQVAKRLERLPEVEHVVPDSDDIGIAGQLAASEG